MTDQDAQFTDKYEKSGRAAQWLIKHFYRGVLDMLDAPTAGERLLEVGCGAGYSTQYLHDACQPGQVLRACDIGQSLVNAAQKRNPQVPCFQASVYALPMADKSVDSIVMLEVLEHLENPQLALRELARVARKRVVISTPREPLWCTMNMARGKYLSHWGNTPGHLQHWSTAGLQREVGKYFRVIATRTPVPWTILRLNPL